MELFFSSRSFYESDATYGRVSGRTDRIAHPIATFLRTYMYRYMIDASAKMLSLSIRGGGKREQRQFHATSRSSSSAVEYESR